MSTVRLQRRADDRKIDSQSTSMAWRPAYQPQLPHTTCGSFVALQRGQILRGAGLSVQLDARRLRLFDFEVFFFGTAMVVSTLEGRMGRSDADHRTDR